MHLCSTGCYGTARGVGMRKKSEDERRGVQRFVMCLPVEVSVPSQEGRLGARTRDVSFRGLYFTVDRKLEVGSAIDFVLTLPQSITLSTDVRVHCEGKVVRVETPAERAAGQDAGGGPVGVAAVIEQYSFLPLGPEESSS